MAGWSFSDGTKTWIPMNNSSIEDCLLDSILVKSICDSSQRLHWIKKASNKFSYSFTSGKRFSMALREISYRFSISLIERLKNEDHFSLTPVLATLFRDGHPIDGFLFMVPFSPSTPKPFFIPFPLSEFEPVDIFHFNIGLILNMHPSAEFLNARIEKAGFIIPELDLLKTKHSIELPPIILPESTIVCPYCNATVSYFESGCALSGLDRGDYIRCDSCNREFFANCETKKAERTHF